MLDGDREHPIPRSGARVLLLDARDRALLFCIKDPLTDVAPFWTMPGGSIEAGETPEQAAVRELDEEVGLREVGLGPCIWRIRDTWSWRDRWYRSDQRVFLARVDAQ